MTFFKQYLVSFFLKNTTDKLKFQLDNFNLKKSYISFLFFCLLCHFLIPFFYYYIFGFKSVYQPQGHVLFDKNDFNFGFLLNVSSLLLTSAVIWILPFNKKINIPQKDSKSGEILFFVCLIWTLLFLFMAGGFNGILKGNLSGTTASYVNLFLGYQIIYLLYITAQAKSSIIVSSIFVTFVGLSYGSRSTPIIVLLGALILLGTNSSRINKLKGLFCVIISLFLSVFLFDVASMVRYGVIENKSEIKNVNILDGLVGRASFLETSMLPIYYKNRADDSKDRLDLFYDKYSIYNQTELMFKFLTPKKIRNMIEEYLGFGVFKNDILPNQYYRAIFMNESIEQVKAKYTSVNITLPVYIYMYTNAIVAVLLYSFILTVIYLLISFFADKSPAISVGIFYSAYTLIYFFDMTDLLISFVKIMLAVFTLLFLTYVSSFFNYITRFTNNAYSRN